MGTQLLVKAVALLNAGCMLKQHIYHHEAIDEQAAWDEFSVVCTFPNGSEVFFHVSPSDETIECECDYNGWGRNKLKLEGLMSDYKIPHRVV